jgi:hypothetical protein
MRGPLDPRLPPITGGSADARVALTDPDIGARFEVSDPSVGWPPETARTDLRTAANDASKGVNGCTLDLRTTSVRRPAENPPGSASTYLADPPTACSSHKTAAAAGPVSWPRSLTGSGT